jgi:L-iditol 2-dehydrogenase
MLRKRAPAKAREKGRVAIMKAAYKKSPLDVQLRDVELRAIKDDEVLIRVQSCGVCGGDLDSSAEYEPFGHELAGLVEKVGRQVSQIKVGDAVLVESTSYCGNCDPCRNGRVDLCQNVSPGSFAAFAEYALAPARNAVPFSGISFKQAGIIEPLGVALDLVYTADIKLNDHVLIIGAGSIGLMALSLARSMGAGKVFVAQHSRSARKIELARAFGADDVIMTDLQNLEDYAFPRKGVDKILITAPPQLIPSAISVANYGATIAFIGFSNNAQITFDANRFHVRKLQLKASFAAPGIYFPTAVEMVRSGVIQADLLISHTFGLDDIAAMMRTLATDRASVVKCVMLA